MKQPKGESLPARWLFAGTLRENLAFSTSGITDKALDQVIKAVGLDYFVSTSPDGYDIMPVEWIKWFGKEKNP